MEAVRHLTGSIGELIADRTIGTGDAIVADLIVLPILDIYRKYYGLRVSMFLLAVFYISMAAAALAVEFLFGLLHLVPQHRVIPLTVEAIRWNYTAWLNLAFLALAALLVVRFFRTGGPAMLRMMHAPQEPQHQHTSQHGVHRQHGPQ